MRVFDRICASCHSVRGTLATGTTGPDLTHVASRAFLAAGTIPNQPRFLAEWIVNAERIKPGSGMPPIDLEPADLRAVVAYLESLR
jgi:cytochrome c oxidase subunit 2